MSRASSSAKEPYWKRQLRIWVRSVETVEGVDVLQWIEGNAAETPSRIVAAQVRNISVRRLMEGNGDDQRDNPGRGHIN